MVGPRVTVLMPVYNGERFLREAINSILGQSFRHFEFMVIDDGSTDRSAEIIASYRDPRIRFIRNNQNTGISATLNKGIALASCELIARMDADDISHPQRLQKQFRYMQQNPGCALLSTWARVVSEEKKLIRLERYRSNFYYYNLTFECWMYHPTIMFRKSAVEQVGAYSMPYSEDYDLFWKMSIHFPIANLAEPLLDYRITTSSLNLVLKNEEYARANEQNVLRNIRYYMGNNFEMSRAAFECLRHNFKPVTDHYCPETVMEALKVLDEITERVLRKENVNRDVKSIRRARYFKRRFILNELAKALPIGKGAGLLVRARAWLPLLLLIRHRVKAQLKQTIKILRNYRGTSSNVFSSGVVRNS